MRSVTLRTLSHLISVTSLAALFALGAGCAGSDGDPGASGSSGGTGAPGQPGTPGSAGTIAAANAERLDITITGVTIASGKPTISFKVVDPYGKAVTGIAKADSRFSMAFLTPAANGKSSEWRAYLRSTSNAPTGNVCPQNVDPGTLGPCPNTQPVKVGTAEVANTAGGVWTETANAGTYSYTFSQALNAAGGYYEGTPIDLTKTHRAGVEIRTPNPLYNASNPLNNVVRYVLSNNPTYDFQPSTGATGNIEQRNIVNNAECNACHDRLTLHGEGRFDIPYCLQCHNTYSNEAAANNSIDMKVMIHKIHRGESLPSVEANKPYYIYSPYSGAVNFSEVVFPQDIRNCTTCHRESDASTPQASNWRKVANSMVCGTCHDNLNFTTGVGHPAASDADCLTCHGPNATLDGGKWKVENVHFDPVNDPTRGQAPNFKWDVVKVEAIKSDGTPGATACSASTVACKVLPGEFAKVTVKVYNPKTGALYKLTDAPFTNVMPPSTVARFRARVAYTTQNYTTPDSGSATATSGTPAQPIQIDFLTTTSSSALAPNAPALSKGLPVLNADGTYTKAAPWPVTSKTLVGGSGVVFLEGRVIMPVAEKPSVAPAMEEIPVAASTAAYFPISDSSAVVRRTIVNVSKCNECHKNINLHGANRSGSAELCATCHNPELSLFETAATVEAGLEESFDSKWFFHKLHSGESAWTDEFAYPGRLNNCEGCHVAPTGANPTYYPPNPALVFGTSWTRGAIRNSPSDDKAVSPSSMACFGCHETTTAKAHMEQNGGDFNAGKSATGALVSSKVESCELCHGPGRSADVKVVHDVGGFRYN